MDPISNADRLAQILRQRLEEQSRAIKRGTSPAARGGGARAPSAIARTEQDHLMRRSVIQDILAEHFGVALLRDPKFQRVIDRVTGTLEDDEQGARLLDEMVADLRAGRPQPGRHHLASDGPTKINSVRYQPFVKNIGRDRKKD